MAGELKVVFGLTATNGPGLPALTVTQDWTPTKGQDDRWHTIGTTEESISFTDIGTNGWVVCQNGDATNYVELGFSTGVYGVKIGAGERAQFRLNTGATVYIKANTAACRVRVVHVGG